MFRSRGRLLAIALFALAILFIWRPWEESRRTILSRLPGSLQNTRELAPDSALPRVRPQIPPETKEFETPSDRAARLSKLNQGAKRAYDHRPARKGSLYRALKPVLENLDNSNSAVLVQGSQKYQLVPGFVAVKKSRAQKSVGEYLGYSVVESTNSNSGYELLYNQTTHSFGVVTNTVIVELKNEGAANSLAEEYSLSLTDSFQAISTAFFQSSQHDFESLTRLVQKLRQDPRIKSARIHIVESQRKASQGVGE